MLANLKEPKKRIFLSVNFFLRLWLILAQDSQKKREKNWRKNWKKKNNNWWEENCGIFLKDLKIILNCLSSSYTGTSCGWWVSCMSNLDVWTVSNQSLLCFTIIYLSYHNYKWPQSNMITKHWIQVTFNFYNFLTMWIQCEEWGDHLEFVLDCGNTTKSSHSSLSSQAWMLEKTHAQAQPLLVF